MVLYTCKEENEEVSQAVVKASDANTMFTDEKLRGSDKHTT